MLSDWLTVEFFQALRVPIRTPYHWCRLFELLQIAANWACVKYVDSAYIPSSDRRPQNISTNHDASNAAHTASAMNGGGMMMQISAETGMSDVMGACPSSGVQSRGAYDRRAGQSNGLQYTRTHQVESVPLNVQLLALSCVCLTQTVRRDSDTVISVSESLLCVFGCHIVIEWLRYWNHVIHASESVD